MISVREAWSRAWQDRSFRLRAALTGPALALALLAMSRFLGWVEGRHGAVLPDPLLALVPPRDVSWLAFLAIYVAVAASLVPLVRRPADLVLALHAYMVMVAFRIAVMWAAPLDPPIGIIGLRDPLAETLRAGQVLTRDLFFSGHVSTIFLLSLVARDRWLRAFLLALAGLAAACVLWQHVHYTVDVLAAPVFAYAAWRAARWLRSLGRTGPPSGTRRGHPRPFRFLDGQPHGPFLRGPRRSSGGPGTKGTERAI